MKDFKVGFLRGSSIKNTLSTNERESERETLADVERQNKSKNREKQEEKRERDADRRLTVTDYTLIIRCFIVFLLRRTALNKYSLRM